MSDDNNVKEEVQAKPEVELTPAGLEAIDLDSLDFSKPESLPEVIRNMPIRMPSHGVKRPLWRVLMSGLYSGLKPKTNKFWFNGKLLTAEEYASIPVEEALAYRNKITKAKR